MNHLLDNNRILAVSAGGLFMVAASILMQRVHDPGEETLRMAERVHGTPVPTGSPLRTR